MRAGQIVTILLTFQKVIDNSGIICYNDYSKRERGVEMKYWKDLTTGGMKMAEEKPEGYWWREATEREYREYRARVARLMGNLEKAIAYKKRILRVE